MIAMTSPLKPRRSTGPRVPLAAAAFIALGVLVSGCSSDKDKPAPGQAAEAPKFPVPASSAQGTPDINSVPTETPTPPSTKDERSKVMAGLVADRANARYSEQPARTMPVAVRPLSDAPPPPVSASTAAVERLDATPPARPEDAGSETATPRPPAAEAAGPAGPGARSTAALVGPRRVAPTGPSAGDEDGAPPAPGATSRTPQLGNGFRTLTEFDSTIYGAGHLLATLDFPAGSLSASERSELGTAATKQQQTRGVVRVIGHGPTKTSAADRATTVARELERLGVPRDQIFTGSETASGPTEVFVHY
jgi:hypothetical protein